MQLDAGDDGENDAVKGAAVLHADCFTQWWCRADLGEGAWLPDKLFWVGCADIRPQQALAVHLVIQMQTHHVAIPCQPGQLLDHGCLATACKPQRV